MSATSLALRIEILREAIEQYEAFCTAKHITLAEQNLATLKIFECKSWLREILAEDPPR